MESPSVGQMIKALFANDQAMVVVAAIVLINCSLYITSNLLIYFFKYDMGGDNWNANYVLFNSFGGAIQILSMMLIYPFVRKFMSAIKVFYLSLFMAVLRMTMTIIPIIGLLLAVMVFGKKYILTDEKIKDINAQLAKRNK